MSLSRNAILNRLRESKVPPPSVAPPPLNTGSAKGDDAQATMTRFTTQLEAAHAQVIRASAADWPHRLLSALPAPMPKQWLLSDTHPLSNTWAAALQHAVPDTEATLCRYASCVEGVKQALFQTIEASLTSAQAAIAETGTLVLEPSPDEPRLMSLVPPLHVAVVNASTLVATFTDYLMQRQWTATTIPTNIVLISGPSKTADIQQTLAYGAHGPKALYVVILTDA